MRTIVAAWLLVWVACAGCSAVIAADTSDLGPPPPTPCLPGSKIQCVCASGETGTQTCNVYERFDPCACDGTAGTAGAGGR